jgi:Ala-tRNA(Pro) deacylase
MAIATKLKEFLALHGVEYDVVTHPHSNNSMQTAELAHVPGDRLAKSVVLEDDIGYVVAVLPSTCHIRLGKLSREMNRTFRLATESELPELFSDCELGAIPPVGLAYGVPTIVDDRLQEQPEIYFEAGDHEQLIRMDRDQFTALMAHAGRAHFSHRDWTP